jgi:hypothetical protein
MLSNFGLGLCPAKDRENEDKSEKAPAPQNAICTPNSIRRIGYWRLVIRPAAEASTLALGKPKFLLFHALKASARISIDVLSRFRIELNLKFFDIDQSALIAPGPRSIPTDTNSQFDEHRRRLGR